MKAEPVWVEPSSDKKRNRMESALWRLERQLKRKFPDGRTDTNGHQYDRISHEIATLKGKLY